LPTALGIIAVLQLLVAVACLALPKRAEQAPVAPVTEQPVRG
jgi:hypothetical protein